ncbi:ATP-grasp domain-containing protein [Lentibacillus cibarius]|uniref:ATP-grasp domain-containing protein n=1 Tax=Lentibacillus cibarius TaxID=2583219 RepID=A0A549YJ94_9BACI|nr:ATP-grasp domain-containing protein [Lentibacillus cibarius]TRM11960.1 ATP-grasp domain-containing protein [Lentibacillus cibarius]
MKLFEYQAKALFESANIPVPNRVTIENDSEVDDAIRQVGLPCVIKAQVLHGGRGKAGLIQIAGEKEEVKEKVNEVKARSNHMPYLLVEEAVNIAKEFYVSMTAEPVTGDVMIMGSAEGGVDIEEVARTMPEKIIKTTVNVNEGLLPYQAREFLYDLGIENKMIGQGTKLLLNLYDVYWKHDAELVEINPLMVTEEGHFVAGDGKVTIDDNALFRHPQFSLTRGHFEDDVQYAAAIEGIPYLQFSGDIGLMCAGAGLTNAVYDLVNDYGGSVASYLEFGGPNYHKAVKSMELIMQNEIKVLLVVTFGTIARADVMAQGLVDAIKEHQPEFPIVTAIRGTGEEAAHDILKDFGLEPLSDTEEAVKQAIKLAGGIPIQ